MTYEEVKVSEAIEAITSVYGDMDDEDLVDMVEHFVPTERTKIENTVKFYRDHEDHIDTLTFVQEEPLEEHGALVGEVKIHRSPFPYLRAISRFIFPAHISIRVFDQLVEDAEEEYLEALSKDRKWHARWIRIRESLRFCFTIVVQIKASTLKIVWSLFRT